MVGSDNGSGPSWDEGIDIPIAVIKLTPEQATLELGAHFYEDIDDLDYFIFSVLDLGESKVMLQRYKNAPEGGIVVFSSRDALDLNIKSIEDLVRNLGLDSSIISWIDLK